MIDSDLLDDMTNLEVNEDENKTLLEKYKPVTQSDINQPFFIGSKWAINVSQLISVMLGLGACLYVANKFPDYFEVVFGALTTLYILIEFGKRKTTNKVESIKIINKMKKTKLSAKPYQFASLFFFTISLVGGFVGGPEIIEEFSSHEPLKNISSIIKGFDTRISEHKFHFGASSEKAINVANTIHERNKFAGKTSRKVRVHEADAFKASIKTDSILNTMIVYVTKKKQEAISIAERDNRIIVQNHKDWCYSFNWVCVAIVFFLDVILKVLIGWQCKHEYRRIMENKAKSRKLKESIKGPVKQSIKDNNKDANYGLEDGEITLGVGGKANTITITLKDGTKKTYTFGKFRNYFKGSSIGRQGELQHYLDKIENYNI